MLKKYTAHWPEVLKLAWPLIIANSFWNLQITVDRIFLGQHSTDALGATITATGLFWAPMALVQQTAAYVSVFIAQYLGAQQSDKVGASFWHSVYASIVGGLLFLLLVPITPTLIDFMGHSENLRPLEIDYFQALCFSALPTALVASISGFFTGIFKTKYIIFINAIGLIFNVLLDYLLIFGNLGFPQMGVMGAGIATCLATWASVAFGFACLFKKEYRTHYKLAHTWRFDWEFILRYFKFGVPSGLQWALEGLAFTVFLIFIGQMKNGDAALSASGITITVMTLGILPVLGIAQAVSVLVGQKIGEKNPDGASIVTWSGLQIAAIYMVLIGISFVAIPDLYLNLFYNNEKPELWTEVSRLVPLFLIFVAAFCLFDTMNLIFSFALKGAGDTRFVSLIALLLPWPLMSFPAWYFNQYTNAEIIAWGFASFYIMSQACIFFLRFSQGKWKKMSVI